MDLALLTARLLLAAVFAVAGIAKLLDRDGSRQALIGFGVPERLAPPLAILLPLAELTVAVVLLPLVFAWWGAIGALALLGLFVVGIAISMARGEAPDCHCFGQIHSEPAGWLTLVRNIALAAVAAFVVAGGSEPGTSITAWRTDLSSAEQIGLVAVVVTAAILAVQAWFLVQLMAQNGRLLSRVEQLEAGTGAASFARAEMPQPGVPVRGLPVGSQAPAFSLSGLYGETITLDALRAAGKPLMLLFTDPNCAPCNAMLPDLAGWQREHADQITIVPISRGDAAANLDKASAQGVKSVLLQQDREVSDAYQAQGTPTAVLVRPDGTVGSPVAAGAAQIEQLLNVILQRPFKSVPAPQSTPSNGTRQPPAPAPLTAMAAGGKAVPKIVLPDLAGDTIDLSDLGGRPTVLLFWNPNCGFCRQMVDDLKSWEANRPTGAPELLILSSGGIDVQQAMSLRTPFLLDEGFEAGRRFGATGTPSAVLISSENKIASNVMVGADNVMGLLDPARRIASANGSAGGNGAQPPLAPLVRTGSPAPEFGLPDLDGRQVTQAILGGSETLVLFWDPSCGFCQQVLDDLRTWERDRPEFAPQLLVISTGAVNVNRQMGLQSTVLLDQGFDVGRRFGASGTPSALLVDRKGKIASQLAAGAPAVFELFGTSATPPRG
jgi:peroxiredoxin/uncharacterized membrane protein YphA (DoxX/SURF4 family)